VVSARKIGAIVAALAALTLACNGVLGIGEATVDPTLADGGSTPQTGCAGYCATIMTNCTGMNAEYIDQDTCMVMCQHFEPGLPDDTAQDSLACRTYHANAAAQDPTFHCRHAGPLGGGVCGDDPCGPYCLLDFALCGDLNPPPFDGGESGCRAACDANFKYNTVDAGDIVPNTGNSLNCRIYHLESAYQPSNPSAKLTHCPHTAVNSATCF